MNSSNVKCLKIHGNFLRNIVNDEQEGLRIIQKVDFVNRSAYMPLRRLKIGAHKFVMLLGIDFRHDDWYVLAYDFRLLVVQNSGDLLVYL